MTQVNLDDLTPENIAALRAISFEYMLARVAEEHAESLGFNYHDLNYFNHHNKLTHSGAFVYPFFIALANGHSDSLYKIFGKFETLTYGPASTPIIQMAYAQENFKLKYFQLESAEKYSEIQIINPTSYKGFDDLQEKIKNTIVELPDGTKPSFCEIEIQSNEFVSTTVDSNQKAMIRLHTPLYRAISNSIEIIHQQSQKKFFAANGSSILYQASYFSAFKKAYKANKRTVINYNEIEPPQKRPFYKKEKSLA